MVTENTSRRASKLATAQLRARFETWQSDLIWIARDHKRLEAEQREHRHREVIDRQQALRRVVGQGADETARWLRRQLGLENRDALAIEAPPLPRKLTPDEFIEPPFELEQEIGQALSDQVTARDAARPWFWLLCHVAWLEGGFIGDNVHRSLCWSSAAAGRAGETAQMEAETRNFLRRTGGIERVRGKVSVLSDCPISRSWWRYRLAHQAAAAAEGALGAAAAHRGLHHRGPLWERLAGLGVKRLTVINSERSRAAVIGTLAKLVANAAEDGSIPWRREDVTTAARELAREGLVRSLDHIEWAELCAIVPVPPEGAA